MVLLWSCLCLFWRSGGRKERRKEITHKVEAHFRCGWMKNDPQNPSGIDPWLLQQYYHDMNHLALMLLSRYPP